MRRKDKEITDQKVLDEIIQEAKVCRLAVSYEAMAYIVPLSFGYENHVLYFHSAADGLKLQVLRENPKACFEVDIAAELVPGDQACDWTMHYKSVIGFGEVEFLEDLKAKREAFAVIMRHYSDDDWAIEDSALAGVTVFKLNISTMTGKKSGY